MYIFEFDDLKSAANKEKHGIDFIEAQVLWADEAGIEILAVAEPEERYSYIAMLDGKLWTAIITYRNENIRLISVRRARKNEEITYEQANQDNIH